MWVVVFASPLLKVVDDAILYMDGVKTAPASDWSVGASRVCALMLVVRVELSVEFSC